MAVKRQKGTSSAAKKASEDSRRKRSVDLLWESRERPSRGPRPGLNLNSIVAAAIEIVDGEGLAALTMSRIAEEVGVTTMALYRYTPSKDELVDVMIDAALGMPPTPTEGDWRVKLAQWVRADRAVFRRHPWLLETTTNRVPIGPNWLAWLESALQTLSGIGLNPREMISVAFLIDGHARSTAQIEVGVTSTPEWAADFSRVLQTVSSDSRFPALVSVAATGGFSRPTDEEGDPFEFGLQRLLDGIETFIRSRPAQRVRLPDSRRSHRSSGGRRH